MESTQSQQAGAVNKLKINTSKTDHSHKADRKRRNGTTLYSPDQNSSGDERLHTAAAGAKRRRKEMESANEGLPDENGTLREVEDRTTPRNKKRKQTRKGREENDVAITMSRKRALEYLRQWDTDLPNWSFRKKAQYWLLQNMLDKSKIPKADFKILLRYMEGLKGNQRQVAIVRAQEVAGRLDGGRDADSEGSTVSRTVYKRSLAVLKAFL